VGILLRTWAVFVVALKRLFSQGGLALATALGLVIAVALVLCIPLYADAIYYRTLQEELSGGAPGGEPARPLFAFMFRYAGSSAGPVEWEDIQALDAYLHGSAGPDLGLPQKWIVQYVQTERFGVFSPEEGAYTDTRNPLAWTRFAFVSDLESRVTLLEGRFPAVAPPLPDGTVEVLVSEPFAQELGLEVGETYIAFAPATEDKRTSVTIPVRIAGVWEAADPQGEFWVYNPGALYNAMVVPKETFARRISPHMADEVQLALWHLAMDGSDFHTSDVVPLFRRISRVQYRASTLLRETRLIVPAEGHLRQYWQAANLLTFTLYALSVPIFGLILAFTGLVVRLAVTQRRNEIATLRSRGATVPQVVGIAFLEGTVLGAIGLVCGLPVGAAIARLMGRARSFLDFTLPANLRVSVTAVALSLGLAIAALSILAQVALTLSAARHTLITYEQERVRTLRPPWWQRAWLDLLLLLPAAYGAYLLRQRGSIALPIAGSEGMVSDPFQNPLLILVPTLGTLALTLLILRFLPIVMGGIAWFAARLNRVGALLAARHLARSPGFYAAPLLLLVLTLSLSTFAGSLAQTLDHHLVDQMYYRFGADMTLVESGEEATEERDERGPSKFFGGGEKEDEGPRMLFLPVSEHLKVPGVRAATRVGRYTAVTRLSRGTQVGTFLGVDRTDFPRVAFWRDDFAPDSLGALMNALAIQADGILVPRDFMARHALSMGDTLSVAVSTDEGIIEPDLRIVGSFDLFPTWYPEGEGGYEPFFVGNLDYIFERAGGQFPYDVWVKTASGVDYERIVADLRASQITVLGWDAPPLEIVEAQQRPERQGVLGLLSVGFLATALLTVLGFLLYAFFSFRRRFIEMGVLRAIGLSLSQMTAFLAWELAFLILVGVVAGTGLGVWVSALFIPYLQVGAGPSAYIPPYVVEIAWSDIFYIYALFGLLFVAALAGLTALLLRTRIFQAIKLGLESG